MTPTCGRNDCDQPAAALLGFLFVEPLPLCRPHLDEALATWNSPYGGTVEKLQ